ncbi:hypothetical protein CKA32_007103 [Geitlerinema sp. FC II]|nr:hypothetical protein CKA32_007103 [Geitlerinema sp. FC II]
MRLKLALFHSMIFGKHNNSLGLNTLLNQTLFDFFTKF